MGEKAHENNAKCITSFLFFYFFFVMAFVESVSSSHSVLMDVEILNQKLIRPFL